MPMPQTALTLATAARLAGVDKSTLRRAVKAGKLSAVRDEHGVWRIEACEVERIYPLALPEEQRTEVSPEALPRHAAGTAAPDAAVDALVEQLKAVIADLRTDRDHWRAQAERLCLAPPARKSWRWWRRRAA